jgi:hypothetical protein
MQMSYREIITAMHGMGFGALLLMGLAGVVMQMLRVCFPEKSTPLSKNEQRLLSVYLIAMALIAWAAVLSGAYFVYPWYRAHPPDGAKDLAEFAQRTLVSNPTTAGWHNLGMEWKEHVAWFAPIGITMVAYVFIKYASDLSRHRGVRKAAFAFTLTAFVAAAIAGLFGGLINKKAPVQGGPVITLMKGAK